MKRLLLSAVAFAALAYAAPANAVVWDMSGGVASPGASGGTTHTFTSDVGGFQITAKGFTSNTLVTPTDLFLKNGGGDEVGLGITAGTDHEIIGNYVVVIDWGATVFGAATAWSIEFGSTTEGEKWKVLGSSTGAAGSFTTTVLQAVGMSDEGLHNISGAIPFRYFEILSTSTMGGGNVLLSELNATGGILNQTSAVPEPSTWAMLLLGFVGLAFAFRNRRKVAGFA
jgi:PEP-CTERM motif